MFAYLVKKILIIIKPKKKLNSIILGTDQAEYLLYKKLQHEGIYQVLFFIDSTPWQLKFNIKNSC